MNINKLASFLLPQGVIWGHRYLKRKCKRADFFNRVFNAKKYAIIKKNGAFNNIHKGERCFILGTDPSIAHTNMKLLKNEHKIFMSQFYLHDEYNKINPKYHIFNSLGGHGYLDRKAVLAHYKQIDEMIGPDTKLFFRYNLDYNFIKKHGLFKDKQVYYIDYASSMPYLLKDGLDATKYFYHPQGCLMSAFQLAIFMGFKKIYLLGCGYPAVDPAKRYHFYDLEKSKIDHVTLKVYLEKLETDKRKSKVELLFDENKFTHRNKYAKISVSVLENYDVIKQYAKLKDIQIYNTTKYSVIDIFPHVDLESLFI